MYATTYKLDYQEADSQNELGQRVAYNISQTSKVSKGVKDSKLRTKEAKQPNQKDKNPANKTKAQWNQPQKFCNHHTKRVLHFKGLCQCLGSPSIVANGGWFKKAV